MEKNVYVLVCIDVNETSGETITCDVYGTRDAARAELKKAADLIKASSEWWNPELSNFEDFTDTPDEFTIWEDGYYQNNHITMMIMEKKVN